MAWVHCSCGRVLHHRDEAEAEQQFAWHQAHPHDKDMPRPGRAERARSWVEDAPERLEAALAKAGRAALGLVTRVALSPSKLGAAAGGAGAALTASAALALFALDALGGGEDRHVGTNHRRVDRVRGTTRWYDDDLTVERRGRWWRYFDGSGAEVARLRVLTGAATLTANGTGNWATGARWSGGSQPTAADDAVLPSGVVITIASGTTALCRSIDVQAGATLIFAATSSNLNIGDASGGAATFSSTCTVTLTGIGTINFLATTASTTYSLATGGKVMPNLTVNTGSTTTIRLADSVTATGATFTLTAGKLNTNNQGITASSFNSSGAVARTLTMDTSVITLTSTASGWDTGTTTNLTMTTNTATITLSGAGTTLTSGGLNFHGSSLSMTGSGTVVSAGAWTLANFTRTGTAAKTDQLQLNQATPTVTGTLTLQGNSATNRLLVFSNTVGTQRSITLGASAICRTGGTQHVDFQDIAITGGAANELDLSAITGKSGDAGGNSGITFTTSATQTHTTSAGGNWSDVTKWTSRVPLPQDDVVVDSNTTGTITADMPRLGRSLTFTGFAGTASFSSLATTMYGSLTLASGMTPSGTNALTLAGRSSHTITSAGKTMTWPLAQGGPGGTYTLVDAINTGSQTISINDGTFTTADQSVTCIRFGSTSGRTRVLNLGASTITLIDTQANNLWNIVSTTGLTVDAGTSTIVYSVASANTRTFAGGGFTYATLSYIVAGSTGQLTVTGANTFATINFSDASNARTLVLPSSTTTTVTNFNVNGTAGKLMTVKSSTGGTAATLATTAGATMSFTSVQDIAATPSKAVYALDSTNVSGNTGVVFIPPDSIPTMYGENMRRPGTTPLVNQAAHRASSW